MTYKELAEHISKMSAEQQNSDVTIGLLHACEFIAIEGLSFAAKNNSPHDEEDEEDDFDITDVLDVGHPYLFVQY